MGEISKVDFQIIGTCGFHCWIQGELPRAEIGFDLATEHWGKGFMIEALKPVLGFGFRHMGLDIIEATVEQENDRSINLLRKLNFEKEPQLRDKLLYFYLNRGRWEQP